MILADYIYKKKISKIISLLFEGLFSKRILLTFNQLIEEKEEHKITYNNKNLNLFLNDLPYIKKIYIVNENMFSIIKKTIKLEKFDSFLRLMIEIIIISLHYNLVVEKFSEYLNLIYEMQKKIKNIFPNVFNNYYKVINNYLQKIYKLKYKKTKKLLFS